MTKYHIVQEPTSYQPINIPAVEEKYGARFVGDFCIKTKGGGWSEEPVAIFYQPNPNFELGHKHYFGLFVQHGNIYITDGTSAFSEPIVGIVTPSGEVLYSRYRHDYRESEGVMIDGGRDYVRRSGTGHLVHVVVNGAVLSAVEIPEDQIAEPTHAFSGSVDVPKTTKNEWTDGPSFIVDLIGTYAGNPNAVLFQNVFDAGLFIMTSRENSTFKVNGTAEEVEELANRFPAHDIRHMSS